MANWTFKARACSDWGYVFYEQGFETEAEARARFTEAKAHAKEHGGAGSLHQGFEQVERFNHWCSND